MLFCNDYWRLLVVLCVAVLGGCSSGGDTCVLSLAADLPVTRHEQVFYTDLTLVRENARLIVDTGSFADILRDTAVRRLRLNQDMLEGVTARGIGGERTLDLATFQSRHADGSAGKEVQFLSIADDALPDWSDGLLGMQLMGPFDDDLDVLGGHVRLIKATGDCQTPASNLGDQVYSVDLIRANAEDAAVVIVTIAGQKLRALIDSGASVSTIGRGAALRIGLPVDRLMSTSKGRLAGIGPDRERAVYGRLHLPISIGALTIANLPVAIGDDRIGDGIDMLLGYDFITTVHVWISHSSHSLLMQYPPHW